MLPGVFLLGAIFAPNSKRTSMNFSRIVTKVTEPILSRLFPVKWKEYSELAYWKERTKEEGQLSNHHYQEFYTTHFGLDKEFYNDKVILDIGCGPRGSITWADNAKRRIGLDPLANEYLKLGADRHNMEYIASGSENIPVADGGCDVIFSFNSLDHVEHVNASLAEIKRCVAPGGLFLLLVEINHVPTSCEPHTLTPQALIDGLAPEFTAHDLCVYRETADGMYQSIRNGETYPDATNCKEEGYFSAKFIRKA